MIKNVDNNIISSFIIISREKGKTVSGVKNNNGK